MKDFLRKNGILLLVIALLLSILIGVTSSLLGGTADPLSNVVSTVTAPIRGGVVRRGQLGGGGVQLRLSLRPDPGGAVRPARPGGRAGGPGAPGPGGQPGERAAAAAAGPAGAPPRLRLRVGPGDRAVHVNWESTLTLDKGSSADVEAGDCVITETGVLVGVVSKVGYNWSTVSTVIDTGIEMGGIVSRTYSAGILEGSFDLMSQGKLRLSYLPEGAQLVSGDEVLTSGRGDVYPSGLVVGQVEGVFTDPSGQSRYAVVVPEAQLDNLIEVFVIKDSIRISIERRSALTRRDLFHKWLFYALALAPVWLLDAQILPRLPLFGVTPMLLPLAAAAVAVLEGAYAGAGFGLAVGLWWEAAYPGGFGGLVFGLALAGLIMGHLSQYVLRQSFPGYLLCAAGLLCALDGLRVARGLLTHAADLGAMLRVAAPEVLWSLVWSPLVWLLFRAVYRRVGGTRLA